MLSCALPSRNRLLNQRLYQYNYQLYLLSQSLNDVSLLNNYFLAGHDGCLQYKYAGGDDVHINGRGTSALAMAMRDQVIFISKRKEGSHR